MSKINTRIFPNEIRVFIDEYTRAIGCDDSYLPTLVLTIASVCISRSRAVKIKEDWIEYPSIYSLILGESGSKKSPAFGAALVAIEAIQKDLTIQYREKEKEYKKALKEDKNSMIPKPFHQLVTAGDATMEALMKNLSKSVMGMLLAKDEAPHFFKSFNAYKSGGGDKESVLELYGSKISPIIRKGEEEPVIIENPFFSFCGGIQNQPLENIFANDSQGMFPRFSIAVPISKPNKNFIDCIESDETNQKYVELMKKLFFDSYKMLENGNTEVLEFTEEAREHWIQWHNTILNKEELKKFEQFVSKTPAKSLRFALILATVNNRFENGRIGIADCKNGIAVAEYFLANHIKIQDLMKQTKEEDNEEKLIDYIERKFREDKGLMTINGSKCLSLVQIQESKTLKDKSTSYYDSLLDQLVLDGKGEILPINAKYKKDKGFRLFNQAERKRLEEFKRKQAEEQKKRDDELREINRKNSASKI